MAETPLGRHTDYPDRYSPQSLYPLPRAGQRALIGLDADLPFSGMDIWRGYELSWLDSRGRPQWSMAEFRVPCDSTNLIESKSFKLYLNSLNMTRFDDEAMLLSTLENDLSSVAGAPVGVTLLREVGVGEALLMRGAESLDDLVVDVTTYQTDASLLQADPSRPVREVLYSDLFRSLCPVTSQPDWGSVYLGYAGPALDRSALLQYIVSFRQHQGFHEDCVEKLFCDISAQCEPEWLVAGIQFLRRGGLEINPWRWSGTAPVDLPDELVMRTARQ